MLLFGVPLLLRIRRVETAPGLRPQRRCPRRSSVGTHSRHSYTGGDGMLWLIVIVLAALWAVGFFIANLGDVIHFLLVLAVVVALGNLLRGVGRWGVGGRSRT